jgi:hypothetical protein
MGAGIGVSTALMPRLGVKAMLTLGFLGAAAGLLIASYIHADSSYAGGILPGLIVFGLFTGVCFRGRACRGAAGARGRRAAHRAVGRPLRFLQAPGRRNLRDLAGA